MTKSFIRLERWVTETPLPAVQLPRQRLIIYQKIKALKAILRPKSQLWVKWADDSESESDSILVQNCFFWPWDFYSIIPERNITVLSPQINESHEAQEQNTLQWKLAQHNFTFPKDWFCFVKNWKKKEKKRLVGRSGWFLSLFQLFFIFYFFSTY